MRRLLAKNYSTHVFKLSPNVSFIIFNAVQQLVPYCPLRPREGGLVLFIFYFSLTLAAPRGSKFPGSVLHRGVRDARSTLR